ncbi:MAG: hypothetical protein WDW36_008318 [Sanguina aurantia]
MAISRSSQQSRVAVSVARRSELSVSTPLSLPVPVAHIASQEKTQQHSTQETTRDLLPNLLSLSATSILCLLFAASPDTAHAVTAISASADVLLTSAPALLSASSASAVPNALMQLADTTTTTEAGIQISTLSAPTIARLASQILRPTLSLGTVLYIVRIPMSWYPDIDGKKLPWVLAYAPTEPILSFTRSIVPLVGGVDVTPIVWVGLLSFFNEILIGPQGILNLIQRQTGVL